MCLSFDENPLTMDQDKTYEIETLDVYQSEEIEIPTMEETLLQETVGIENPSSNSSQCDQLSCGSLKIEDTQQFKILEENIEDAHNPKTLEESSEVDIEDACIPESIDNSLPGVVHDLQRVIELSVDENKIIDEKLDEDDDDDDDDDDEGFRLRIGEWYLAHELLFRIRRECYHCGSFCLRRFHSYQCMGHCQYGNRNPFWADRDPDPYFMRNYENPHLMKRLGSLEFAIKEKEESFFGVQKWNEPEPYPVGAGLANMGNTCFLNAILQCFTHTVPLVQGLQAVKHESSSHGEKDFCVLCAVHEQIKYSIAHSGRVIAPSNLVNNLNHISSSFRRHQQEDAHEFLQCLLDKLDSNWSKYEANAKNSSLSDDSLIKQVFGGHLVSQIHCCQCGHNSDTYEPLVDLSLEIVDVDNLESALKSFTKVESMKDTENYTCGGCKEKVQVEKQIMLTEVPPVASFHLKRFRSDGIYVEKIDKTVAFPLELDLQPYIKGNNDENGELKYDLFAVVVHVGRSSSSGHYFCYIRSAPHTWYQFDDEQVTRVGEEYVVSQEAYILFYARKETPWFSSLIENERSNTNTSPNSVLDVYPSSDQGSFTELLCGLITHDEGEGEGDLTRELGPSHDLVKEDPAAEASHIQLAQDSKNPRHEYAKRKEAVKSKSMARARGRGRVRRQLIMMSLMGSRCLNKRRRNSKFMRPMKHSCRKRIKTTLSPRPS